MNFYCFRVRRRTADDHDDDQTNDAEQEPELVQKLRGPLPLLPTR